jgi:hypothetical protein
LVSAFGCFQSRLGFVVLIIAQFIFALRLLPMEGDKRKGRSGVFFCAHHDTQVMSPASRSPTEASKPHWIRALQHTLVAWGLVVTLVAFVISMNDTVGTRFAEGTIVVGLVQRALTMRGISSSNPGDLPRRWCFIFPVLSAFAALLLQMRPLVKRCVGTCGPMVPTTMHGGLPVSLEVFCKNRPVFLWRRTSPAHSLDLQSSPFATMWGGLEGKRVGCIEGLYIMPEVRPQGLARMLLQASRGWARQQRCAAFASDRSGRIVIDKRFWNKLVSFEGSPYIPLG